MFIWPLKKIADSYVNQSNWCKSLIKKIKAKCMEGVQTCKTINTKKKKKLSQS